MGQSRLGLPLEYNKLSEYFDAHNIHEDTDAKNEVIRKLLQKHVVKTVLDLTCGTGSQVFYLIKHGFKVIGADFSPDLLKIARQRASKDNVDAEFIDGDMRTINVGKFDAIITIFNAIGHLTKGDFEKAIKNIHNNLDDGGLYIFDIFNLQAMTDKLVNNLAMDLNKTIDDVKIHNIQYSTIEKDAGLLTSYDNYSIQKNDDKPKVLKNEFTLQIYTVKELREILAKNGFEVVEQYSMDGTEFLEDESSSMLTVARKIWFL